MSYIFNSAPDEHKLEQTVRGHDFRVAGKRVDALLKTHGLISVLSFGELKTHETPLLKDVAAPYRQECWQVSDELAGGIAQVQRSVQAKLRVKGIAIKSYGQQLHERAMKRAAAEIDESVDVLVVCPACSWRPMVVREDGDATCYVCGHRQVGRRLTAGVPRNSADQRNALIPGDNAPQLRNSEALVRRVFSAAILAL